MKKLIAAILALSLGISTLPASIAQDFGSDTKDQVAEAVSALSAKKKSDGGAFRRKLAGAALALSVLGSACGGVALPGGTDGCQLLDQAFGNITEAMKNVDTARTLSNRDLSHKLNRDARFNIDRAREMLKQSESSKGSCDPSQKAIFADLMLSTINDIDEASKQIEMLNGQNDDIDLSRADFYAKAAAGRITVIKDQAQKIKNGEALDSTLSPASTGRLMIQRTVEQARKAHALLDKGAQMFDSAIARNESTVAARLILNEADMALGEAHAFNAMLKTNCSGCGQKEQRHLAGFQKVLDALNLQNKTLKEASDQEQWLEKAKTSLSDASKHSRQAQTLLQVLEIEMGIAQSPNK